MEEVDICRVCRSEGTPDRPLYYPCVCTGSIKYIHQECLVQWLRYSRKEYCELCNHRFAFTPIYAPDMPKRLPIKDLLSGLVTSIATAIRFWLHYTLVAFAWLGVVPLSACRIHRSLFAGSVNSILALPLDLLSTDNLLGDIFHGCIVVMCTLCIFISLVWLREHIMHGNGPEWLDIAQEDNGELLEDDIDVNIEEPENINVNPPNANDENNGMAQEAILRNDNNNNNNGNDGENPRAVNNNVNNDEVNWNPMEWERAAEELTWERLLGLDGSLLFLEHVLWVVSFTTLFILIFEFCPYHIGHFTLAGLQMQEYVRVPHFETLLVTLSGYGVVGIFLVLLHGFATTLRLRKSKKIIGLSYVVVKVCLLSVIEIGVFPLACGWWLDICSLSLFNATLKDREASFAKAPGTSMFMHWLFGMIYVFYFASFVLLLREVLRPGVLWFLRNLNDPDLNPIQEMIHLPILKHVRRFLFSMIIFGTTVILMVWLPVRIIKKVLPDFLPYNFLFTTEQTHELSLELVLLQVMMPALLEQGQTREWIKTVVRWWCIAVSWVLDLRSYLLGDDRETPNGVVPPAVPDPPNPRPAEVIENNEPIPANDDDTGDEGNESAEVQEVPEVHQPEPRPPPRDANAVNPREVHVGAPVAQQVVPQQQPNLQGDGEPAGGLGFVIGGGLGAAHQALLSRDGPTGFLPYKRPHLFPLKIVLLLVSMCATLTFVSIGLLTIPVCVGRLAMNHWLSGSEEAPHELYTSATGLYVTWVSIRLIVLVGTWVPRGWQQIYVTVKKWSITISKALVAVFILLGLIPFLCGLVFEMFLISPLRIPITQTPMCMPTETWVMGTLYVKIACAVTMMTPPNFWLRRALERIYNDGFRNLNLNFILLHLAAPCVACLGLALAIPYVISQSVVPMFVTKLETQTLVERRIYPFVLVVVAICCIVTFQIRQFKKLYEHIKNDKYLVGRRLVNYERPPRTPPVIVAPS